MAFRLRFLLRQISDPVFETSDSKRLPVKYSSQSDFESLDFDIDWVIDWPRGLASLVLTKRNAASGNEIAVWPVPYACAQPYYLGSGSHGQLFRPC